MLLLLFVKCSLVSVELYDLSSAVKYHTKGNSIIHYTIDCTIVVFCEIYV